MIMGLLTMAAAILAVKPIFDSVSLLWIISIRMMAGVLGSFVPFTFIKDRRVKVTQLFKVERRWILFLGFFLSAYVSISLWIAGYKYLQASVASVLNQTSTIFTVLLAIFSLKEELTAKKVLATILATVGVIIMSAH